MTMKVLFLLLMPLLLHPTQVGTSTCRTTSVTKGEPTELSCDFKVNVNETKNDFNVQKYNDGGLSKEILSCVWLHSDEPSCGDIPNGYTYNGLATSSLTIGIPSAAEEHVGTYFCQVVQADELDDIVPCNFTLKVIAPENESDNTTQGSDPQHISEKGDEENRGWIAAPVVGVLAVVLCLWLVWWKRQYICKKLRRGSFRRSHSRRNRSEHGEAETLALVANTLDGSEPWHGRDIKTREEAENLLSGQPEGSFIVCPSDDPNFTFSLFVIFEGRCRRKHIYENRKGFFSLNGKDFTDMNGLIEQTVAGELPFKLPGRSRKRVDVSLKYPNADDNEEHPPPPTSGEPVQPQQ